MNTAWEKVFAKDPSAVTVNCRICSKSFKDERGLHVHVTKAHRKRKQCENEDQVSEEKEQKQQVRAPAKKKDKILHKLQEEPSAEA